MFYNTSVKESTSTASNNHKVKQDKTSGDALLLLNLKLVRSRVSSAVKRCSGSPQ